MREFKFNIDDWTGGNTLGKSMGDAVGSTVDGKLFTIVTDKASHINIYNNGIINATIDWGDGETSDVDGRMVAAHDYDDNKADNRVITVYSNSDFNDVVNQNLITTAFLTIYEGLLSYTIYAKTNKNLISRYLECACGNIVNNIIFDCDNVEAIGTTAFVNTFLRNYLNIPSSVRKLGEYCFGLCSFIRRLDVPHTVKEIGDNAFYKTTFVEGVKLNEGLEYIGENAFYGCNGFKGNFVIPSSVKEIGDNAFSFNVVNECTIYVCEDAKINGTITNNENTKVVTYKKGNNPIIK